MVLGRRAISGTTVEGGQRDYLRLVQHPLVVLAMEVVQPAFLVIEVVQPAIITPTNGDHG